MTTRLTVLGSIGVVVDRRSLHLGGPQQRRLLAVLLADVGRVVPIDRLTEVHLPDDPDRTAARATVRTYVSRLRAVIGESRVITRDGGYSLSTEGATVDSIEFEIGVRRARLAAPAEALALYDEALALWRGRAYGEFADEWWALPESARLEELRLGAHHGRVDALLALGRHDDAVADLERLSAASPLRERFAAQLMTALYRSGRHAEAHRVYHAFRRRLAEETGLDPSAALVELERSMSTGDPVIAVDGHRHRGYVLSELIGRGSYGDVYRSKQPGVERDVAVKAIRSEYADRPSFIRRFEAEAQMVARVEHPHVVPLYDFWRDAGAAYLVLRYLRGGSLEERLETGEAWPLDRVDRLVEEIGGALVAAHAAGIVHGDVKASNVLFDELGNAYLSDFGIAVEGAGRGDTTAAVQADVRSLAVMTTRVVARRPLDTADTPSSTTVGADAVSAVLETATGPTEAAYRSVAELLVAWREARDGVAPGEQRGTETIDAARALAEDLVRQVNPYKGLRAFGEADAAEFYGRDRLVDELLTTVLDNRFVVVVGSSGSGKSSLVHAGLVPKLRQRSDAFIVSCTPGSQPRERMVEAIGEVTVARRGTGDGDDLGALIAQVPEGELVIVVDQAEELWTLSDEAARSDLLRSLAAVVTTLDARTRVVMTVRADLFDRVLDDGVAGPFARRATFGVTPMSADELHDAVVRPAAHVGVRFDERLVTRIVSDFGNAFAGLPLLQFALAQLYDLRTSSTITLDDYERIGALGGALASHAEALFASLDEAGRDGTRELFTRLVVAADDHTAPGRRRVRITETANIPPAVVDVFVAGRLLTVDHDGATREPTIEVAHEALFGRWPRLREWIEVERSWIQVRATLSDAARNWELAEHDDGELFRGVRLERAVELADGHRDSLIGVERDFLDAAVARRDADANRARVENRRLRRFLVVTTALLVIALVAGVAALAQRREARAESHRAETSRIMASAGSLAVTDTPVAALLALEASRRGDADGGDLDEVMQRTLTAKPHFLGAFPTVGEYLFSDDSSMMLARTSLGLEVYDVTDHRLVASAEHPTERAISGRRLATGGNEMVVETAGDDAIRRYRLPELTPIGEPIATPGSVRALAMSANGVLVSGQPGGLVVLWDAETGRELRRFTVADEVFRLDLSVDGTRLVVATSTQTTVHDTETLAPVGPPLAGGDVDVAISPNGRRVSVQYLFTTDTFDVATGELILASDFGAGVRYVDDDRIAISVGTHVDVIDVGSGAVLFSVPTTCGCDLDVSPDGRTLVTGLDAPGLYGLDGREALASAVAAPPGSRTSFVRISASPSGRTIAISPASGGGLVYRLVDDRWTLVREVSAPATVIVLDDDRTLESNGSEPHIDVVEIDTSTVASSIPVAADGFAFDVDRDLTRLAYTAPDGTVVVVDATTGVVLAELTELNELNVGNDAPFIRFSMGPRFSTDGSRLAASTWSGAAVVWDTESWTATTLRFAGADVNSASTPAFDPTGRLIAVSAGRRAMALFDAVTLEHVRDLPLPAQGLPTAAAFSGDGSRLAVTLDTAITVVLDVATGRPIGAAIRANFLGDLRFLTDGRLAVTDSRSDAVLIWDTTTVTMSRRLCALAGRNLSRSEWSEVGPAGQPYHLTCSEFPEPPDDPTLSRDLPPSPIER